MGDLSDERLVASLRELLAAEGLSEARIVAHLAEVDARRIHLKGAPSLFEYCQKQLGLSDCQAYYRIAAARVAQKFPVVFELLEQRAIHLTNIAPLAKHLTTGNHFELLGEADDQCRIMSRLGWQRPAKRRCAMAVMSEMKGFRGGAACRGPGARPLQRCEVTPFHPARSSMPSTEPKTVADVMTRRLVTVSEDDVIANIDDAMHRLRVRHMPVIDDRGKLVGLLSHPDLLHAAASFLSDREADGNASINQVKVGRIMQRDVVTAEPGDSLVEAGKLMWDAKIGCLPVVESDGTLVGIITEADFIAIAVDLLGGQIKKSDVEELARSPRTARARLAM